MKNKESSGNLSTNPDLIPPEFVVFEPTVNKSEIKKRLTAGEKVQGAELTERVSVQIR